MNPSAFVALVTEMRAMQRAYFKTRDGEVLHRSKQLEKQVDKAIVAMEDDRPSLFDTEEEPDGIPVRVVHAGDYAGAIRVLLYTTKEGAQAFARHLDTAIHVAILTTEKGGTR